MPIYVAATGQRTLRMAGHVADAALISGMPDELPRLDRGHPRRRAGGRSTRRLDAHPVLDDRVRRRGSPGRSRRRSRQRRASRHEHVRLANCATGHSREEDRAALERLQAAHQQGHLWDTGYADLVPERWIDRFSVAGTPDEVRARLERTLADGADEISMILMSARSPADAAAPISSRVFAESVMQPLRAAREVTA